MSSFFIFEKNGIMHACMEEEHIVSTAISIVGVFAILVFSLTNCGKARTSPQKPSKNVKEGAEDEKSQHTKSSVKDVSSQQKTDRTIDSSSQASTAIDKSKPPKKTATSSTQEASELPATKSEMLQLANTQASNSLRSSKRTKNTTIDQSSKGTTAIEPSSTRTARQKSTTVGTTQSSGTKEEGSRKQQKTEEATTSEAPTLKACKSATVPPRDLERDKEMAAKALSFIRAKRMQQIQSMKEKDQALAAFKLKNPQPELRDPSERAQVLSEDEEKGDQPGIVQNSDSATFPTIDKPDIVDGEKLSAGELEKENREDVNDEEENQKEPQKKKFKPVIGTPDNERQFRPVSDIPADDLTLKREIKKKKKKKHKKKKKKSKKRSDDSSSDDEKK